jgi:uncharacterized protein (TIGR03437 family)
VTNVPDGSIITVTVSDRPALVGPLAGGQITFQVPPGTAVGAAVVRITANGEPVLPAVIRIDPPPAVLLAVQTVTGQPISAPNAARPGELVQLVVGGLTEAGFTGSISQLKAASGSLAHNVFQVQNAGGVHLVQVQLNPLSPTSEPLAVTLSVDGRAPSQSILVPVR